MRLLLPYPFILLFVATPAYAQTFGLAPEAFQPIVLGIVALIVPMAIAFLKGLIGKIPDRYKVMIPLLAPIIGLGLDAGIAWLSGTASNGWLAVIAGAAGVFVREVKDQLLPAAKS
jgi:hypothetical protein